MHDATHRSYFGAGSGRIVLDNMVCQGQEAGLSECNYERYENGNINCDHTEDAGVRCEGTCM